MIRGYYEQLYVNKFNDLDKLDKLKTQLTKLTQEERQFEYSH